jgi:hypothetical protein
MSLNIEIQTKKLARQLLSQIHKIELELDMQENELLVLVIDEWLKRLNAKDIKLH